MPDTGAGIFASNIDSADQCTSFYQPKCIQRILSILAEYVYLYHRERILETSTLSCSEEEEEITKPPKR